MFGGTFLYRLATTRMAAKIAPTMPRMMISVTPDSTCAAISHATTITSHSVYLHRITYDRIDNDVLIGPNRFLRDGLEEGPPAGLGHDDDLARLARANRDHDLALGPFQVLEIDPRLRLRFH